MPTHQYSVLLSKNLGRLTRTERTTTGATYLKSRRLHASGLSRMERFVKICKSSFDLVDY